MIECLKTNKVCPASNKKCKICKLEECRGALNMLEIQERNIRKEKMNKLQKQLSEQCRHCSFLEVIDLDRNIVRCFYMIKNSCIRGNNEKKKS